MINYLTHKLYELNSKYKYDHTIYKCKHCNIVLYGSCTFFCLVRTITEDNELINVAMGNKCILNCNEYIIKKLLE